MERPPSEAAAFCRQFWITVVRGGARNLLRDPPSQFSQISSCFLSSCCYNPAIGLWRVVCSLAEVVDGSDRLLPGCLFSHSFSCSSCPRMRAVCWQFFFQPHGNCLFAARKPACPA